MAENASGEQTVSLGDAMDLVRRAVERRHFDDAANILEQILAAKPDYVDAVNFLAGVRYHQRELPEALALSKKAVELAPDDAGIRSNLATMYLETAQFKEAITSYQQAVHLDPTQVEPIINLAWMLKIFESYEEAEFLLKKALELKPDSVIAHQRYSSLLYSLGRNQEALDHGYAAMRFADSERVPITLVLRAALRLEGKEAARKVLEEALALNPGNLEAKHLFGSLDDQQTPQRASDGYVEETFDDFANSFDEKLQRLNYRAPDLIGDCLDAVRKGKPDGEMVILDAGCGTGWSGQRLRKHASKLVGIDLSAGMLKKAKERGGYDALHKAELVSFIEQAGEKYDAIISADTLCYFGDLGGYCAAARGALEPGGVTIFSLEEVSEEAGKDYVLTHSGRYEHKAAYVRDELSKAGFDMLSEERVVLRQENLEDVKGLVYVARIAE